MKVVILCSFMLGVDVLAISGQTAAAVTKTFDRTQYVNESVVCAFDEPSLVISFEQLYLSHSGNVTSGISPLALCALQCTRKSNCTNFNLKVNQKVCELFDFTPQRCSNLCGCDHLQVSLVRVLLLPWQPSSSGILCLAISSDKLNNAVTFWVNVCG